jgi:hypothetical protein
VFPAVLAISSLQESSRLHGLVALGGLVSLFFSGLLWMLWKHRIAIIGEEVVFSTAFQKTVIPRSQFRGLQASAGYVIIDMESGRKVMIPLIFENLKELGSALRCHYHKSS